MDGLLCMDFLGQKGPRSAGENLSWCRGETEAQTPQQTTELGAGGGRSSWVGGVLGGATLGRTAPVSVLGAEASPSPPCVVLNIKDLTVPEPAGTGPESRRAAKTHSRKQGVPVKGLDG